MGFMNAGRHKGIEETVDVQCIQMLPYEFKFRCPLGLCEL
jgi:hypothetical protein